LDVAPGAVRSPAVSFAQVKAGALMSGWDAVHRVATQKDGIVGSIVGQNSPRCHRHPDIAMTPVKASPTGTSGRVDNSRTGDNAVSDVCGLRGVDHPNDLQLNPFRQQFEKAAPSAKQHRDLVDLQVIENASRKRCLCRIGAMDQDVAVPCGGPSQWR